MSGRRVEKEPRLLPVAEVDGREFLVDVENRLFRNFNEPDDVIGMHSEQARRMLREMQGTEWRCHGIWTGKDEAEV